MSLNSAEVMLSGKSKRLYFDPENTFSKNALLSYQDDLNLRYVFALCYLKINILFKTT